MLVSPKSHGGYSFWLNCKGKQSIVLSFTHKHIHAHMHTNSYIDTHAHTVQHDERDDQDAEGMTVTVEAIAVLRLQDGKKKMAVGLKRLLVW